MESSLYLFIAKHGGRALAIFIALTLCQLALSYSVLEIPKAIVNLLEKETVVPWLAAFETVDSLAEYLAMLCTALFVVMLARILVVYLAELQEARLTLRLLGRIRQKVSLLLLRKPLTQLSWAADHGVVDSLEDNTNALGEFVADAYKVPLVEGGTLFVVVLFSFQQSVFMGGVLLALWPIQWYLIPRLQHLLKHPSNIRSKAASSHHAGLVHISTAAQEVRVNGTALFELARLLLTQVKLGLAQFTVSRSQSRIEAVINLFEEGFTLLFYLFGGFLVLEGKIALGALVAVIASHRTTAKAQRTLFEYFALAGARRRSYQELKHQLDDPELTPTEQVVESGEGQELDPSMGVHDVALFQSDKKTRNGISFDVEPGSRVILTTGPSGNALALAQALAGLRRIEAGTILFGGRSLKTVNQWLLGRSLGYIGSTSLLVPGSARDNLLYGLRRPSPPQRPPEFLIDEVPQNLSQFEAAEQANYETTWLDHDAAGTADDSSLSQWLHQVSSLCGIEETGVDLGLHARIGPGIYPDLTQRILQARRLVGELFESGEYPGLVETFDNERYNLQMNLLENILFGIPRKDLLQTHGEMLERVLLETGLMDELVSMGLTTIEILTDLFSDLPPGDALFAQFEFYDENDKAQYEKILHRYYDHGSVDEPSDRSFLLALSFQIIVARHRLGLVDESLQARIVTARGHFRDLIAYDHDLVEPFDSDRYNSRLNVEENILFGRMVFGRAHSAEIIAQMLNEKIYQLELEEDLLDLGLMEDLGYRGQTLSRPEQHRLLLGRALVKRPGMIIVEDGLRFFNDSVRQLLLTAVDKMDTGTTVIWVARESDANTIATFDRHIDLSRYFKNSFSLSG